MERTALKLPVTRSLPLWLFLALFMLGTWPTLVGLSQRWLKFDESYSHGFLVLLVSAVLCIGAWKRTKPIVGFHWPWLVPLLAALMIYSAGEILLIEAFQQVALVPLFLSGLLAFWGWRQTLPFVVPIGLLTMTLPFWDYLSWSLQLVTVAVNQFMLSWFDIEFTVEGVFVYFPGVGAFEIAHGCSGLRYLLVGVTLSLLYGELNLQSWCNRVWLVLIGILFALVANWLRVFIIIYAGYQSDMTSSLIEDHDFFGWWVFGATLIPLFFIARWMESKEPQDGLATKAGMVAVNEPKSLFAPLIVLVPIIFIIWVTWFDISPGFLDEDSYANRQHSVSFVSPNDWLPLFDRRLAGWRPEIVNPDRVTERSFARRGGLNEEGEADEVLFVGLYSYDFQRPNSEVVQYRNRLYNSSTQLPERTFEVAAGNNVSLSGLTLRYRQSDVLIHLAYGYYVEGRWERTDLQAKLAQLPGIFNDRTDASLLVIGLQCASCEASDVLKDLSPMIQQSVEGSLDNLYLRD